MYMKSIKNGWKITQIDTQPNQEPTGIINLLPEVDISMTYTNVPRKKQILNASVMIRPA